MLSDNFALMVRVRGDVSVEQVSAALNRIQVRHPALLPAREMQRDQPANEVSFPLAVRMDCDEQDWIEVAQAELRQNFPEHPGPLARFTLLKRADGFDLLATFHHEVCDGMSGMFVLRDFLQALGNPQAQIDPIPAPPPTIVLAPKSALADPGLQRKVALTIATLRVQILLEKLRRLFSPKKKADAPAAQELSVENPPLEQQFVLVPVRLTAAQTAALAARCKKEQVSVHAALCVAWLRAFRHGETGPQRRMVSSPVNLRERLSPSVGETSGLFLSLVETTVDCGPERDFWDVARDFKQKLAQGSRDENAFFIPLLFSKLFTQIPAADLGLIVEKLFSGPVKYDFSITNLGRLPIPERSGALEVEAFYGPLVNSTPYERTVGISTLAGQMSMTFLFRKSMMTPASGKELTERAIRLLTEA